MSFWDHLDVLRGTLIRSLVAVLLLMIVGLSFGTFLFDKVIMLPADPNFVTYKLFHLSSPIQIVNLDISGQFMVHLRASLMLGIVIGFPYIIFELWKFIAPALYPNEKRGVGGAFLLSSMLFYVGVVIGYFILLPVCLAFFQGYILSDTITNTFSLASYMSMFSSMVLMIGVIFEFPVLIMILSKIGVLNRSILKKGRKYAFLIIMILAALITPADVGSMIIVTIPLYGLYELSILFCAKDEPEEKEEDVVAVEEDEEEEEEEEI